MKYGKLRRVTPGLKDRAKGSETALTFECAIVSSPQHFSLRILVVAPEMSAIQPANRRGEGREGG